MLSTDVVIWLGAFAATVNAIGVLLLGAAAMRTHRMLDHVHNAVCLPDGRTLGEAAQATATRDAVLDSQGHGVDLS